MSSPVLLVTPVPRASQIKGWWCTHCHMLGCWLKHHISRSPVDQQRIEGGGGGVGHLTWSQQSMQELMQVWERSHLKDVSQTFHDIRAVTVETLSAELGDDLRTPAVWTVLWSQLSDRGMPVRVWRELKAWKSHGLSVFPSKTSSKWSRNVRGERDEGGPDYDYLNK